MNRLIKSFSMRDWSIELHQIENTFVVVVEDQHGVYYKQPFDDLNYANFMFETRLHQLQGH